MDPKRLLMDLETQLAGSFLSETFEVQGFKFDMRTLDEGEFSWSMSKVSGDSIENAVALAMEVRLPTLAIGIRSINGNSIISMYEDEWKSIPQEMRDRYILRYLDEMEAKKFFSAEMFISWLSKQPPNFIKSLYNDCWLVLANREKESQGELKNSSGESSEMVEKSDSTELSRSGEQLQIRFD
jgi:hypothetical protein